MQRISIVLASAAAVACLTLSMLFAISAEQHAKKLLAETHAAQAAAQATADYVASVAEVTDRVIDLPEDGSMWYTSVLTSEQPTAREQQILAWFDRDQSLAKLKQQTHWHHYTPASAVYQNLAGAATNGLPVVMIQTSDGTVVYKVSGMDVPPGPLPLTRAIIKAIRNHCPLCPKPKPQPTPAPAPSPIPDLTPDIVPDVVGPDEDTAPNGRDDTLVVTLVAFVAAVGIGFLVTAKGAGTPRIR